MRRIIVAVAFTCSFAIGILAGFSNREAAAKDVCWLSACNTQGVRMKCCINTITGVKTCGYEQCGLPEFRFRLP
jgi:hypothetical protein